MIASLPMYVAHPAASAALWQYLADALRAAGVANVPTALTEPADADLTAHWLRPDLLLSQCCGYQLVDALQDKVQLVGLPRYSAQGCDGILYSSLLVCRADDTSPDLGAFQNRVAAYNSVDSQSGYQSLRSMVAPLALGGQFFARAVASGAHSASLALIQSGQADVAAVDCISYAQFQRYQPGLLRNIRILGHTASAPGTAWVTALGTPPAVLALLRQALQQAMADPAMATTRDGLLLEGLEVLPVSVYAVLRRRAEVADGQGIWAAQG